MGALTKADIPGIFNATVALTAAYTVVAADRGKLFDCTGTFTVTLTAAATLGAGFSFAVRNSGTGVITLDPNLAELVDGVATVTLTAGESALVTCNGTAFKTAGRNPDASIKAAKLDGEQSGAAPIYAARAWVNFNGTGTVAIRASGNVSSITDNGVGDYTVNFTTAMPDENYTVVFGYAQSVAASAYKVSILGASEGLATLMTDTQVRLNTGGASASLDYAVIAVTIFR